ncbi:MAG: hypothetical protein IJ514_04045 [Clostridia bacterium]|nr:hypothetical protein [Clostridia bacterium]
MEKRLFEIPKLAEFFDGVDETIGKYRARRGREFTKEDMLWAREELLECLQGLDYIDLKILYYVLHLQSVYKMQAFTFLRKLYEAENGGEDFIDRIFLCR